MHQIDAGQGVTRRAALPFVLLSTTLVSVLVIFRAWRLEAQTREGHQQQRLLNETDQLAQR